MAFLSTSPPLFVDLRAHPSRRPLPVRTLGANGLCIHEVAPRSRADGEGWSRRLGAQASHAGWNKRLQTHFQYVWGNLVVGLFVRSPGAQRRQFSDFLGTICRFPARSADIFWLGLLLTLFLRRKACALHTRRRPEPKPQGQLWLLSCLGNYTTITTGHH